MRLAIMVLSGVGLCLLASSGVAHAAQTAEITPFRYWWDFAWRIGNFLILAFLLVKVAKEPLQDFLKSQREGVAEKLQEMEEARVQAIAELEEVIAKTKGLEDELADFESRLTVVARKEREEMLADAKRDSELIIESGKLWAKQSLLEARRNLAGEILNLAGEISAEELRAAMTRDDQVRMVADFTREIKKAHAT